MKISEIVSPNSSISERIPISSSSYNNGSFIYGYYWMEYLTNADQEIFMQNVSNTELRNSITKQIISLLRKKEINYILK